jgi:hypothetical protein
MRKPITVFGARQDLNCRKIFRGVGSGFPKWRQHPEDKPKDTETVARPTQELRLAITISECGLALDHLAPLVRITIDQTEEAINILFPGRFIER